MKWAVFTFGNLDGLCASAIVVRAARLRNISCRIAGFLSYENPKESQELLNGCLNSSIFVLDFSPDRFSNLPQLLDNLKRNNILAYWCTHHTFAPDIALVVQQRIKIFDAPVIIGERLCSAEMVQRRLLPDDSIAKSLAIIARSVEFLTKENSQALNLNDLIASGFDKKILIQSLSLGVAWSDQYARVVTDYQEHKIKLLSECMKHFVVKNYVNANFGFILADSLLSSADACQYILDSHNNIDVAVAIFRNGRISFRRKNGISAPLDIIAHLFDGGGHPYASGGILREFPHITNELYARVLFVIDQKLKKYFFETPSA